MSEPGTPRLGFPAPAATGGSSLPEQFHRIRCNSGATITAENFGDGPAQARSRGWFTAMMCPPNGAWRSVGAGRRGPRFLQPGDPAPTPAGIGCFRMARGRRPRKPEIRATAAVRSRILLEWLFPWSCE